MNTILFKQGRNKIEKGRWRGNISEEGEPKRKKKSNIEIEIFVLVIYQGNLNPGQVCALNSYGEYVVRTMQQRRIRDGQIPQTKYGMKRKWYYK